MFLLQTLKRLKQNHKNVIWKSENAKKAVINPDGIAGIGYDICYEDENGRIVYVEVKSTTGSTISFIISDNELRFAEEHAADYELYIVTSVMCETDRKIYILQNLFDYTDGETRQNNSKFSLGCDNYTINCNIITENHQ